MSEPNNIMENGSFASFRKINNSYEDNSDDLESAKKLRRKIMSG